MPKKNQASLLLTLSAASTLIAGGVVAYWILLQQKPLPRDLPLGANVIPRDAIFTVSLSTDPAQWQKLRQYGTPEIQAALDQNLVQWRDRFLTDNGYNFQKDIQPWVGDRVTIAVLPPEPTKANAKIKPVVLDRGGTVSQESTVMVLPIENQQQAQKILTQPKPLKQGKWTDRSYKGISIKEIQGVEENYSAALLDEHFLIITDNPKATERAIDAFKGRASLASIPGYSENIGKITTHQPFAQVYVNVPVAAKITGGSSNRRLPAQALARLQHNQGLAATINLEQEGIGIKGISWLHPKSDRTLVVENKAGRMQNRLPSETLMMLSGGNLQQLWQDYVVTSQGNPRAPLRPERLRAGIKSLTEQDLEQDWLSWMNGEFSVSVIPSMPKEGSPEDFRAALVFMVQASDRSRAEAALEKLDQVMANQYQFKIEDKTVDGKPVVNWIAPFGGTLTASHGWLDGDVAFISLGAPITEKILPKPDKTLASALLFQKTVPSQLNRHNGQFFLDVDDTVTNFPLPTFLPNQKTLLEATRSIGVTAAVSDEHSTRYDIFLSLKKVSEAARLPNPASSSTPKQE